MPEVIEQRQKELLDLCTKYPVKIPVEEAAKFMGMDKDCLRESIDQGKCRFGVGGKNGLHGNRFCNIPTLAFYNWHTMGANLQ